MGFPSPPDQRAMLCRKDSLDPSPRKVPESSFSPRGEGYHCRGHHSALLVRETEQLCCAAERHDDRWRLLRGSLKPSFMEDNGPLGPQHIGEEHGSRQKLDYGKQSPRKFVRSLISRALKSAAWSSFCIRVISTNVFRAEASLIVSGVYYQ